MPHRPEFGDYANRKVSGFGLELAAEILTWPTPGLTGLWSPFRRDVRSDVFSSLSRHWYCANPAGECVRG